MLCGSILFTKKETITLVKEAYPGTVSPDVTIQRWYRDFEKGRESGELKPYGGSEKSVNLHEYQH